MLSVKIELCLLGWNSSSLTAVQQQLFYTIKCICVKYFQAVAKISKKITIYIK